MYETRIRIEQEYGDKLKVIAKREKRSLNGQIEYIIERFIDQYEKDNSSILTEKPCI